MPYVKQEERNQLDPHLRRLADLIKAEGDLNYCVTQLVRWFVLHRGESYAAHNAVMGVLTCASLEHYRRSVAPYEDNKITQNGDLE